MPTNIAHPLDDFSIPAERGCGTREEGGIYIDIGLSQGGSPIEDFIIDPPVRVDDWDIPQRGVKLIERNGIYHVIDRVGCNNYPNVLDMVEEIRRLGLSRRVQSTLDFSKITSESRILLVHDRAFVENFRDYGRNDWCPKNIASHTDPNGYYPMCARVWFLDLDPATVVPEATKPDNYWRYRQMPSFSYLGQMIPPDIEPQYVPAIFMSLPISKLVVIQGEGSDYSFSEALRAQVDVYLKDK